MEVPFGYCECGCGEKTSVSKQTDNKLGYLIGKPKRFIKGHSSKVTTFSDRRDEITGNIVRRCTCCKDPKSLAEYPAYGSQKRTRSHTCRQCTTEGQQARRRSNREHYLFIGAKARAGLKELPFSIQESDVHIPDRCPILGTEFGNCTKEERWLAPSLDQIIPGQGYVPGNVQVISLKANVMKNDCNPEQLLRFASWIHKAYGEDRTVV